MKFLGYIPNFTYFLCSFDRIETLQVVRRSKTEQEDRVLKIMDSMNIELTGFFSPLKEDQKPNTSSIAIQVSLLR